MIETQQDIGGLRLAEGETFRFACGPHLACFNTCCRNKRLPLWPYDVIRLRSALGLTSDRLLAEFAELEIDPRSGWPALRLRLDENGRCPFVSTQGCRVYPHRPAACRLYPLARAVGENNGRLQAHYFRQQTENCLGWAGGRDHSVASWTEDQDLTAYDRANDLMYKLLCHPHRRGRLELDPRQTHAVIAALYNPDVFRRMTAHPGSASPDQARLAKALDDDLELLLVGRDFLLDRLFR